MGASAVPLEAVTVSARRGSRLVERAGPGAVGRSLSADQLARLPVDALDLKTVATLVPGVLALAATDSTETDFSVAGQRPTANAITLDGLSLGGGSVPQDAIRSRSEEHTSELQSPCNLVCRLLLEKKKKTSGKSSAVKQDRGKQPWIACAQRCSRSRARRVRPSTICRRSSLLTSQRGCDRGAQTDL